MAASALAKPSNAPPLGAPHPLDFFGELAWVDGRPLLDTIERYRRAILSDALFTFETDGTPRFNFVLCGRAKKNFKNERPRPGVLVSLPRVAGCRGERLLHPGK